MEENKKNKILVVAAHPDDEVLGCGGTMAKYAKTSQVYVLFLGEGITSRYQKREEAPASELLELKEKAKKACQILGAKEVFFLGFPDQRFDTVPFLEITKKIEESIKNIQPNIIFTHSPADLNLDHRIAFEAVLTATRPQKDFQVKEIYSFQIPSSTEWSFGKINGSFSPNVFEEISLTIEKKIEAMRSYDSEIREFPHPRSEQAILSLAKKWGSVVFVENAEAFELIRIIK